MTSFHELSSDFNHQTTTNILSESEVESESSLLKPESRKVNHRSRWVVCADVAEYDSARVRIGQEWAKAQFQRAISDTTKIKALLTVYSETCLSYQHATNNASRDKFARLIWAYERDFQDVACVDTIPPPSIQRLEREMVNLKRLAYLARYGNYTALCIKELQENGLCKSIDQWPTAPSQYDWTAISGNLKKEACYFASTDDDGFGGPTIDMIRHVCENTGFDYASTVNLIHMCADSTFHLYNDMEHLLKEGGWRTLATTLHQDLYELQFAGCGCDEYTAITMTVVGVLKDRWFDPYFFPEKPRSWSRTKQLDQKLQALQASQAPLSSQVSSSEPGEESASSCHMTASAQFMPRPADLEEVVAEVVRELRGHSRNTALIRQLQNPEPSKAQLDWPSADQRKYFKEIESRDGRPPQLAPGQVAKGLGKKEARKRVERMLKTAILVRKHQRFSTMAAIETT